MIRFMTAVLVLGTLSASAFAAESKVDEAYYTIDRVTTRMTSEEVLDVTKNVHSVMSPAVNDANPLDEVSVILDQVIAIGKKVWTIVENNQPVVNVKGMEAAALPQGATEWTALSGWKAPVARTYETTYTNLFGMDVVTFSFRVVYTYAGSVNGKGAYLANVAVMPANVSVAWGYTFNSDALIKKTVNVGSKDAPVAGMELLVNWSVSTPIKKNQASASYFVQGDGTFKDLN